MKRIASEVHALDGDEKAKQKVLELLDRVRETSPSPSASPRGGASPRHKEERPGLLSRLLHGITGHKDEERESAPQQTRDESSGRGELLGQLVTAVLGLLAARSLLKSPEPEYDQPQFARSYEEPHTGRESFFGGAARGVEAAEETLRRMGLESEQQQQQQQYRAPQPSQRVEIHPSGPVIDIPNAKVERAALFSVLENPRPASPHAQALDSLERQLKTAKVPPLLSLRLDDQKEDELLRPSDKEHPFSLPPFHKHKPDSKAAAGEAPELDPLKATLFGGSKPMPEVTTTTSTASTTSAPASRREETKQPPPPTGHQTPAPITSRPDNTIGDAPASSTAAPGPTSVAAQTGDKHDHLAHVLKQMQVDENQRWLSAEDLMADRRRPTDTEKADMQLASGPANLRPLTMREALDWSHGHLHARGQVDTKHLERVRRRMAKEDDDARRKREQAAAKAAEARAAAESLEQSVQEAKQGTVAEDASPKPASLHFDEAAMQDVKEKAEVDSARAPAYTTTSATATTASHKGAAADSTKSGAAPALRPEAKDPHDHHHQSRFQKPAAVPEHAHMRPISAYAIGFDDQGRRQVDPSQPTVQSAQTSRSADVYNKVLSPSLQVDVAGQPLALGDYAGGYSPDILSARAAAALPLTSDPEARQRLRQDQAQSDAVAAVHLGAGKDAKHFGTAEIQQQLQRFLEQEKARPRPPPVKQEPKPEPPKESSFVHRLRDAVFGVDEEKDKEKPPQQQQQQQQQPITTTIAEPMGRPPVFYGLGIEPAAEIHNMEWARGKIPAESIIFGADGKPISSQTQQGVSYGGAINLLSEDPRGSGAARRSRNNTDIYDVSISPSALTVRLV